MRHALSGHVAFGPVMVSAATHVAELKAHIAAQVRHSRADLDLFKHHRKLKDIERIGEFKGEHQLELLLVLQSRNFGVVTWGDRALCAPASVAHRLRSAVIHIYCNVWAFAALQDLP